MADMTNYITAMAINNPGKGDLAEYIEVETVFLCVDAAVAAASKVGADAIQVFDHVGLLATACGNGTDIRRY